MLYIELQPLNQSLIPLAVDISSTKQGHMDVLLSQTHTEKSGFHTFFPQATDQLFSRVVLPFSCKRKHSALIITRATST